MGLPGKAIVPSIVPGAGENPAAAAPVLPAIDHVPVRSVPVGTARANGQVPA